MPYEMRKTGPKSKPWCVFNKVTGAKKGCSKTEAMAKKFMAKLYVEEGKKDMENKAVWSTATINKLPDSAFLYVEKGKKDSEGKTTPRSLRHLPYKDANGKVDLPHLRNAIARAPQTKDKSGKALSATLVSRIQARARKLLAAHGGKKELEDHVITVEKATADHLVIEDAEGMQYRAPYSITEEGEFSIAEKEEWLELKDVSLTTQSRRVRKAFYNKFGSGTYYSTSYWVTEGVFKDYLIVEDYADYELYKVSYTEGDDGYEFAEKDAWKKVEVEYVEKESTPMEEKDGLVDKVKQLWEKVFPPESAPLFVTKQQEDGRFRWVAISSTAFLDGEEEIVSIKALADNQPLAEKDYGELRFWHVPIKLGNCDFQMPEGVCLVESGLWDDNEIANPIRKAIDEKPKDWKVSIGFLPLQEASENVLVKSTVVKKVWDAIQIKERSVLPRKYAANKFACIITEGGITVDESKMKVLRETLGDELATQVISTVDELNKKALEDDAVVKGQETPTQDPEPAPEKEVTVEELKKVLKELGSLPDRFKKLEEDMQKLRDDVAPRAAISRASEDTDTTVSKEKAEELVGPTEIKAVEEIVDTMLGNI